MHDRPPAFEGPDGQAYSAGIFVDESPDDQGRFGVALVFVQWSETGEHPVGHLETPYLAFGDSVEQADAAARRLSLHEVKEQLDRAVAGKERRPW